MGKSLEDLPAAPDPWNEKSPEKMRKLTMVWYIVLFHDVLIWCNRTTQAEVGRVREKLNERRPSVSGPALASTNEELPRQPVIGDIKTRMGVVGRAFIDGATADKVLYQLIQLSPPPLSTNGRVEVVQQKLDELVPRLVDGRNPLDIHGGLLLIPSFTRQVVAAARYRQNLDLATRLLGLENMTRIILIVRQQEVYLTLFALILKRQKKAVSMLGPPLLS
jgi:hypothetical protein